MHYSKKSAKTYDSDPYDLLHKSQELVHQQLISVLSERQGDLKVGHLLDVAVGLAKGLTFANKSFDVATFTGNDASTNMLEIAQTRFPHFTPIHGDAVDIHKKIPENSIDVAYIHYIMSYVDSNALLDAINQVLKPGGIVSIATTTWEHLRDAQQLFEDTLPSWVFDREKLIKQYNGMLMRDSTELKELVTKHNFKVLREDSLKETITIRSFNEFWEYARDSGWHLQLTNITGKHWLDKTLFWIGTSLLRLRYKKLRVPLTATTNFTIITIQKPKR